MSHWTSAEIAKKYSAFRPHYPAELFNSILKAFASINPTKRPPCLPTSFIDVGCGSGQAIEGLLSAIRAQNPAASIRVLALDPSAAQLKEAEEALTAKKFINDNTSVTFVQGDAGGDVANTNKNPLRFQQQREQQEAAPLRADIVTVAQALHWIDMKNFARNLLDKDIGALANPGGLLAAWNYPTNVISSSAKCNEILNSFDQRLLREGFWPPQRHHIENDYQTLVSELCANGFDFIGREVFVHETEMSVETLCAYLSTWSGLNKYIERTGKKDALDEELRKPFQEALRAEHKTKHNSDNENANVIEWCDSDKALTQRLEFHLFLFKPSSH